MSDQVEITFKCSQNIAALMMAFYAIMTNENPEDSIIGTDYFGWIVDELGERSLEYGEYIVRVSGGDLSSGFADLIESYAPQKEKQ